MSYMKKIKSGTKGEDFNPCIHEKPEAVALMHERMGQPFQAVRVRLWNGLAQREAHRGMVERWQNSRLADEYAPPPVPRFLPDAAFDRPTPNRPAGRN